MRYDLWWLLFRDDKKFPRIQRHLANVCIQQVRVLEMETETDISSSTCV